jgi:iron complex transport system substrate-binding protein
MRKSDIRSLRFRVISCLFVGFLSVGFAEPLRVVSQTVGTDEMLLAVADPEQIVALSHISRERDFSAVAVEAAEYDQIGQGDAETILKFRPDLVLVADYSRGELVSQLERAGVELMVFDRYATMDDAFDNLRMLAERLGPKAETRAAAVIAEVTERQETLKKRLASVRPVKVIAPSTYGIISGGGTTFQDLCDHAAAENLATTVGELIGHADIPRESMLTWPVEQVVLAGYDLEPTIEPFLTLIPFRFMDAVKERRVALIEPYMFGSVTHYRMDGYERLARQLHPERFEDK